MKLAFRFGFIPIISTDTYQSEKHEQKPKSETLLVLALWKSDSKLV